MYRKPQLEKFGTFRELTQIGFSGASDGFTIIGPNTSANGCDLVGCASGASAS